ncbi:hypothetical protein SAMN05660657_05468 [Geodermatophilus amargosae]|uniref:Uncharacterized protein n=1 Tax=Geodermatophilus amargosae TaxID=1296565 RepID=A0A1I7D8G8_9ACTN|nr:hypothetical protein [Geodermatophilus amargosae]SFU08008.1 hypothetical protein SAMN05660657_05468 [Geodermatophilus amargosae]
MTAPDGTAPRRATEEVSRLRAQLAVTQLERDDLARRLAAALEEPPVITAGQDPLPLPDLPGGGHGAR